MTDTDEAVEAAARDDAIDRAFRTLDLHPDANEHDQRHLLGLLWDRALAAARDGGLPDRQEWDALSGALAEVERLTKLCDHFERLVDQNLAAALRLDNENERLRKERDEAYAHDEAVCRTTGGALSIATERLTQAEAENERLRAVADAALKWKAAHDAVMAAPSIYPTAVTVALARADKELLAVVGRLAALHADKEGEE